ncbi:MAG: type I-MYXAN CRISPR-associated Cas8a1/Cmx1 [Candidatus Rokubacteria bacterium]|nr:type I-MYXAN CRISPR-associated Cas8a1/Cmx1 [Candidatus Rokubacteria bacterium]
MAQEDQTITWRLSDRGMGVLERAGLAALHMTLRAAEEQSADLRPLRWTAGDLTPDSVTLRWKEKGERAFKKLFEYAWQVRDGVFYLPGVHREDEQKEFAYRRVPTHNGLLGTFLQHINVQPRAKEVTRITEQVEEDKQITVQFKVVRRSHIKPIRDLKKLFLRKSLTTKPVTLSGWVMPGIAPRYGTEKAWQGHARLALLLMLAPIACLYLRLKGKGSNRIVVAPDVSDLDEFSKVRPTLLLSPDAADAASLGDAGLRFAAEYATRSLHQEMPVACRVVAMGKVDYYRSQSVRKAVLDVKPALSSVERYQNLLGAFPNTYVSLRDVAPATSESVVDAVLQSDDDDAEDQRASGYFRVPSGRGRIADNIVAGRPWYSDLFTPLVWDVYGLERQRKKSRGTSVERIYFKNISYQRRNLMELIQEQEMWDTESERYFVEAFWEILASLYAQEAKAVERGGSRKVEDRLDDLNEDIRRSLMRAKTRVLLRGYLAELFAKGGRQPALVQNRAEIWKLMDHPWEWKRARDLALLALATYQSKEKRGQAQAQSSRSSEKGEQS